MGRDNQQAIQIRIVETAEMPSCSLATVTDETAESKEDKMSVLYNEEKMTEREEEKLMAFLQMNAERSEEEKRQDLIDNCNRAVIKLEKRIKRNVKEGTEDIKNGLYDITIYEYFENMGFSNIGEVAYYYFRGINKLIEDFSENEYFRGIESYEEIKNKTYENYVDIKKIITRKS